MDSTKKLVFISHMKAEWELAMAFKKLVQKAFLGMIDVFVASDPESLSMGKKWLAEITDALKRCHVEIVFASPASTSRPWINFEAGAGWIRDIPVIPICHSGLNPDNCYPILNHLQGGTATSEQELRNVFGLLAKTLDCNEPNVDFADFIAKVKEYESTSATIVDAESTALVTKISGLRDYEFATMVACGDLTLSPGEGTTVQWVRDRMEEAHFAPIATTLGLAGLKRYGLIETYEFVNFQDDPTSMVRVTPDGWQYLTENVNRIELRTPPSPPVSTRTSKAASARFNSPTRSTNSTAPPPATEDEIPF